MQHAVRYVEEGLLKLTQLPGEPEADDAEEQPATELELELRSVLGAPLSPFTLVYAPVLRNFLFDKL